MPRKPREKNNSSKNKKNIRNSNYARLKPLTARVLGAGHLWHLQKEGCWGWYPDPKMGSAGTHLPYCFMISPIYSSLWCFNASRALDFPAWLQMGCRLGYGERHHLRNPKHHLPCVAPLEGFGETWLRPRACQHARWTSARMRRSALSTDFVAWGCNVRNQHSRWPVPGFARKGRATPSNSGFPAQKKTSSQPKRDFIPATSQTRQPSLPGSTLTRVSNQPGLTFCLQVQPAKLQGMLNSDMHLLS